MNYENRVKEFRREVIIRKRPHEVFQSIVSINQLRKWIPYSILIYSDHEILKSSQDYLQTNDTIVIRHSRIRLDNICGLVLSHHNPDFIKVKFGMLVTASIYLHDLGRSTKVVLVNQSSYNDLESNINSTLKWVGFWTFSLLNLKAYCEHNVSLKEKDNRITGLEE